MKVKSVADVFFVDEFDAVNGMLSKNSSSFEDPSVVSKVAIGFDDAIACIRLLNKLLLLLLVLLRVLREEEETTFLITRRVMMLTTFLRFLRKNLIQKLSV